MDSAPLPLSSTSTAVSKVLFRFSCQNLPKRGVNSDPDPQIKVFLKRINNNNQTGSSGDQWKAIGSTEVLKDQKHAVFAQPISIDYFFEQNQHLRIECFDVEETNRLESIGYIECSVGDVVGARKGRITRDLISSSSKSFESSAAPSVTVISEEDPSAGQSYDIVFEFRGEKLDKKDLFGKSDPLLEIYRPHNYFSSSESSSNTTQTDTQEDQWMLVHRTEYVKQDLNPRWKQFRLSMFSLCQNDENCPILLKVLDWNKSGKYSYIGEVKVDLATLKKQTRFDLINEKKRLKKGSDYKRSGTLIIDKIEMIKRHTFLDYLMHGMQINLVVGIDYTGSNGTPSRPQSLHYIHPNGNAYTRAISSVASILLKYDYDGMVPVFGFGALMPDRTTSHCFAVNKNEDNPNVKGLDGILEAYKESFSWVKLDGPTNFATLIRKARQEANELQDAFSDVLSYLILLIITDGEICDMNETISEIIEASDLPMSIIIVGVGKGPFDNMEHLDSDDELLADQTNSNRRAKRDIVQFVCSIEDYQNDPEMLAKEVLEEIPDQVTQYFASKSIYPKQQQQ